MHKSGIARATSEITKRICRSDATITPRQPKVRSQLPGGPGAGPNVFVAHMSAIGHLTWLSTKRARQLDRSQIDIFWGPAHRLPMGLGRSVPCVVTIHDLVWAKYPQTMRRTRLLAERILSPHAMRRADAIIAISNATRDDVIERFPHFADKIRVIYPGASRLAELSSGKVAKPAQRRRADYALFVGTIEPRKNIGNLLHAIAITKAKGIETGKLIIVGAHGWRHEEIGALIDRFGLSDCVSALGYVSDAGLAELYQGARFLAMPSLCEGFGLPIIEAGSYGVPALTSNVSSMPEAAGKAGLFVDPLDPHDIARGWQRLWHDDAQYKKLRSLAVSNAARFSWSRTAEEMLALFQEVIDRHRKRCTR